jgi:hypothetical protein
MTDLTIAEALVSSSEAAMKLRLVFTELRPRKSAGQSSKFGYNLGVFSGDQ